MLLMLVFVFFLICCVGFVDTAGATGVMSGISERFNSAIFHRWQKIYKKLYIQKPTTKLTKYAQKIVLLRQTCKKVVKSRKKLSEKVCRPSGKQQIVEGCNKSRGKVKNSSERILCTSLTCSSNKKVMFVVAT